MEDTTLIQTAADGHAVGAAKDIMFGSMAGMVGKFIEYPFDTIKVRLQSQPDDRPLRFRGPLDCLSQSLRADGISGLYRGLSSPLVGAAVENAALFFSYNLAQTGIKSVFYPAADANLPLPALVASGGISGAFASVLLTPIELIKCKMQVQALSSSDQRVTSPAKSTSTTGGLKTSTAALHTASSPPPPRSIRYAGPITLAAEVVRVYGVKGLWRGQMGTFFRESGGSAAWFGSYEYVSKALRQLGSTPKEKNTPGEMMLAGACAGVGYNFILFPADTVKSRMQTEAVGVRGEKGKGFWAIGGGMYRAGGLKSLYRGCGITVARSAPSSAVIFLVYETLKSHF